MKKLYSLITGTALLIGALTILPMVTSLPAVAMNTQKEITRVATTVGNVIVKSEITIILDEDGNPILAKQGNREGRVHPSSNPNYEYQVKLGSTMYYFDL